MLNPSAKPAKQSTCSISPGTERFLAAASGADPMSGGAGKSPQRQTLGKCLPKLMEKHGQNMVVASGLPVWTTSFFWWHPTWMFSGTFWNPGDFSFKIIKPHLVCCPKVQWCAQRRVQFSNDPTAHGSHEERGSVPTWPLRSFLWYW